MRAASPAKCDTLSLLQGSGDASERRIKGGPKRLHRGKDHDGNASRNQGILDSRCARLVIPELAKTSKHLCLLVADLVVARTGQLSYFRAVDTLVKVVFKAVPVACTAAMIAMEIPAAIKPYSIAVAPDWSFQNLVRYLDIISLPFWWPPSWPLAHSERQYLVLY